MTPDRKIVTHNSRPPIPTTKYDWCAFYDGEEEAGNYGCGATEEDAIADFIENCAEDHDERLSPTSRRWMSDADREAFAKMFDCPPSEVDYRLDARAAMEAKIAERREYEDPMGHSRGRF